MTPGVIGLTVAVAVRVGACVGVPVAVRVGACVGVAVAVSVAQIGHAGGGVYVGYGV